MTKLPTFLLFTDGACLGNPGPGGWAYILRDCSGNEVVNSGGDDDTTNQKMEVTAVLRALESLKEPSAIDIHADSQYVTRGLMEWMDGWISKGLEERGKETCCKSGLVETTRSVARKA